MACYDDPDGDYGRQKRRNEPPKGCKALLKMDSIGFTRKFMAVQMFVNQYRFTGLA